MIETKTATLVKELLKSERQSFFKIEREKLTRDATPRLTNQMEDKEKRNGENRAANPKWSLCIATQLLTLRAEKSLKF